MTNPGRSSSSAPAPDPLNDALKPLYAAEELSPFAKLIFVWFWGEVGNRPGYIRRFRTANLVAAFELNRTTVQKAFDRLVACDWVCVIKKTNRVAGKRGQSWEYDLHIADPRERLANPGPAPARLDPQQDLPLSGNESIDDSGEELPQAEGIRRDGVAAGPGRVAGEVRDERFGGNVVPFLPLNTQEPNRSKSFKTNHQETNSQENQALEREASGGKNAVSLPPNQQAQHAFANELRRRQAAEENRTPATAPKSIAASIVATQSPTVAIATDSQSVEAWTERILAGVNKYADPRNPKTAYVPGAAADVASAIVHHGLNPEEVYRALASIAAKRPTSAGAYADVVFGRLMSRVGAPYRRFGKGPESAMKGGA